jgi:hypothetical protein
MLGVTLPAPAAATGVVVLVSVASTPAAKTKTSDPVSLHTLDASPNLDPVT